YTHFAQGIALYDSQQHRASTVLYGEDTGVVCHIFAALTLWLLGYPAQGRGQLEAAGTLAQPGAEPLSPGGAFGNAAVCHQCFREVRAAQEYAESAISLATEQGFPYWTDNHIEGSSIERYSQVA